jgi:hypothetical protein
MFKQNEAPSTYVVFGITSPRARGFMLNYIKGSEDEKNCLELKIELPATVHDLQDMFAFAGLLANYVKSDGVINQNGETLQVAYLKQLYTEIAKSSNKLLHDYAQKGSFYVNCLMLPLKIPENVCKRIANVPYEFGEKFFSSYLAEKQQQAFRYLAPEFVENKENGEVCAIFTINENEQVYLPKQAFIPINLPPFTGTQPSNWQIIFVTSNFRRLEKIDYNSFINGLQERAFLPFDDDNYILKNLSETRMQEIIDSLR